MDAKFWHQLWETNTIRFHQSKANPLLVTYFKELLLEEGSRIFIPLCGKTLAIAWFLSKGYQVVGVELSELAIQQLFVELGVEAIITDMGKIKHYSATNIDIFVGDIFELTGEMLGSVDAIYDRAALVALSEKIRRAYSQHLIKITNTAPQLLITFEYEQNLMDGPPFSINSEELNRHYQDSYNISALETVDVVGGLKGISPVKESAWLLKAQEQ